MESYCVIQFKTKQEKVLVLNLLAAETEVDFKITTDLKGFVEKQFNGTFVENGAAGQPDPSIYGQSSTSSGHIQNTNRLVEEEKIEPTIGRVAENNYFPPLSANIKQEAINNMDPDLIVDAVIAPTPSDPVFQPLPDHHNELDYDPYLPYQQRINAQNMVHNDLFNESNFFDETNYYYGDDQHVYQDVSSTTRSGRKTTRRRCLENEDGEGSSTPSPKKTKKSKDGKLKTEICSKCGMKIISRYSFKANHAMSHLEIIKFECLVENCGLKFGPRNLLWQHMDKYHKDNKSCFKEIPLNREQNEQVAVALKECFVESGESDVSSCKICQQHIGGKRSNSMGLQRLHSITHVDFMLFKCPETGCHFEAKTRGSIATHQRVHGGVNKDADRIKLTKEQEKEVEQMWLKCFPEYETSRVERADSEE